MVRHCGCCCCCLFPAGTRNLCCKSTRYVQAYLHRQSVQLTNRPLSLNMHGLGRASENEVSSTRRDSEDSTQCKTRTTSFSSVCSAQNNGGVKRQGSDLHRKIVVRKLEQCRRERSSRAQSVVQNKSDAPNQESTENSDDPGREVVQNVYHFDV